MLHLVAPKIPRDEEGEPLYEDFICQICSGVFSFLTLYPKSIWAAVRQHDTAVNNNKEKNVLEDPPSACVSSQKLENDPYYHNSGLDHAIHNNVSENVPAGKDTLLDDAKKTEGSSQIIQAASPSCSACVVGVDLLIAPPVSDGRKPMFLSKNWRDILCRCEKCVDFYTQKHINFLLDKEDSIVEYEKMAKQKREEKLHQQEGVELNLLDKLGHVGKMEFLNGVADMKNEIHAFLVCPKLYFIMVSWWSASLHYYH